MLKRQPTQEEANELAQVVSKSSSTPCGIIDGYPLLQETDTVDFLRRGCIPVSRPPDELVRYAKTLENIIGIYTSSIDFKLLHESVVPHWVDLLEGVER